MIIRRLKMSEANKVIKSNISGVERVLVRGKGWIPTGEVEEANEVKTMAGWIKLGMETMSNIGS
jgi:hypothetical protein